MGTSSSTRSELSRRLAVGVTLLGVLLLTGCGRTATPGCDASARVLADGQVSSAAAGYAKASRDGEGDCADRGIAAVESAFSGAWMSLVDAEQARREGDLDAATAGYVAAQELDRNNPMVVEWSRQGGELPVLPSEPVPPTHPVESDSSAAATVTWPWYVGLGLLMVLLGGVGYLVVRGQRPVKVLMSEPEQAESPLDVEVAERRRQQEMAALSDEIKKLIRSSQRQVAGPGVSEQRVEELLDAVVDHLDGLLGQGGTHDRLAQERSAG